jgi:hypothetical protein
MANDTAQGILDDPANAEDFLESCKSSNSSDRQMSKFLLQLKWARPSSDSGGANVDPRFLDGFLAIIEQVGYNQFLEVSDACTARICKPLRPRVVPVAAKPNISRTCTLLNRLQDGVMDTCGFLAEATSAWEDGYCVPVGFVLFETEPSVQEIRCRRTDPLAWHWRRSEGRNPIHLCFEDYVSRSIMLDRYPDSAFAINSAQDSGPESILGVDPPSSSNEDVIKVCHVWRRKVGEHKGIHIVAIGRTVLNGNGQGEEWPYDFFPVAVFRNRWDYRGFGGVPLGRYLAPHHIAMNKLARTADESFKGAIPLILSHKDSGLNELSDVPYQVAKWKGTAEPRVQATNPVSEQVLRRIDYHDLKSYALAGINKALAAGQAPRGVTAAVAMREIVELADARANEFQKHWEAGWEMAGHIIVALANELKKVRVRSGGANQELMSEIDVSSIKLDRNDYRIRYSLTSALSQSVSGLLSDLGEFKDLGFITPVQMAIALGDKVPDLQAEIDAQTAPYRLAQKQVQSALEDGVISVPPSRMMGQEGLDAIVVIGQKAWCQAMLNPERYSPENLEALRRLMKASMARKGAPQVALARVQPGDPIPATGIMPIGTPVAPGMAGEIARNKYESASLGVTVPGTEPVAPTVP